MKRINPLSARLFMRRNFARTAPVTAVIALAVVLIGTVITVIRSIDLTVLTVYGYNRHFAVVIPRNGVELPIDVEGKLFMQPNVKKQVEFRVAFTTIRSIFGKLAFALFGLRQEDMSEMLRMTDMRLVQGRMPKKGAPECVLSIALAKNKKVKIGDTVLGPNTTDSYSPIPVKLVGLLDGENWFAVMSYEYVAEHYFPATANNLLSSGNVSTQAALDDQIKKSMDPTQIRMFTFGMLVKELRESLENLYLIMRVVVAVVVLVLAIMMGLLSNIFFTQRLPEFALLTAMGYTRKRLLGRIIRETSLMVVGGWVLGAICTVGLLNLLNLLVFAPRGLLLNPYDIGSYAYTMPLPITVLAFASITAGSRLLSFDPVAIIERKI